MSESGLRQPGASGGLREVFRHRFLLKLLVSKELKVRYRGSVLGILWSYVKPAVQFLVFWIAVGVFLGLDKQVENFPIYLFSGIILLNYFTEALSNASRSIVRNGELINKIYLPRELFPIASVWVSAVHFVPQIVILIIACLFFGWVPSALGIVAIFVAFAIVSFVAIGLGLFFGSVNVYFRDSENFVDMLVMVITWASPILYMWSMVQQAVGDVGLAIYQLNPLTVSVELFHLGFWLPTTANDGAAIANATPPNMATIWVPIALAVSVLVLLCGQWTFRRLERKFAQEL